MCTWKRFNKLKTTLDTLKIQTNTNFEFYILNNNIEIKDDINNLIEEYRKYFKIYVNHFDENIGPINRFLKAKEIISLGYKYVAFIDDDCLFDTNLVDNFYQCLEPKTIVSRWSWTFNDNKRNYWNRTKVTNEQSSIIDYTGSGGMVCDISVFNHDDFFNFPDKYKIAEDLWLSYFAKYKCNYKLKYKNFNIKSVDDNHSLWITIKELKTEFLCYLEDHIVKPLQ